MDELTNSPSRRHAMIAENLLPFYQDAAKARQKDHGGTAPGKSLVVILPQVKARDAAGKAAGVSGSYVDKASDPEALADFQKAMAGAVGAPIGNDNAAKPENKKTNNSNTTNCPKVNRGKAYTLSRLKRETPELFAAVVRVLQATGRTAPITPAEAMAAAPKLQPTGRPKKGSQRPPLQKGSNSKVRLAARINRDHPEIAERVKAGDPQRLFTLIRLARGFANATDALAGNVVQWRWHGSGLVIQKTEKSYLAAVLSPCRFRRPLSLLTQPICIIP